MFRANSELHTVRGWQPAPFLGGGLAGEDFAGQRPASSLSVFCLFVFLVLVFFQYQSHHLKRNSTNGVPGDAGSKAASLPCWRRLPLTAGDRVPRPQCRVQHCVLGKGFAISIS